MPMSGHGSGATHTSDATDHATALSEGLDRFRTLRAATYSARQGLLGTPTAVLDDPDGSTWFATNAGLYRLRDGRMLAYRPRNAPRQSRIRATAMQPAIDDEIIITGLPEASAPSFFLDHRGRIWFGGGPESRFGYLENNHFVALKDIAGGYITSVAEDNDRTLWIALGDNVVEVWRVSPDLTVRPMSFSMDKKNVGMLRLAVDPVQGGLWIGFFSGGITHFVEGKAAESYSATDGLGKGAVNDVRVSVDRTVWASTNGGLSRIKSGRIATLSSENGLPCDAVHSWIEDDEGSIWVYTACGLVRIPRSDFDAWAAAFDQGKATPKVSTFVLDDSTVCVPNEHLVAPRRRLSLRRWTANYGSKRPMALLP